MQVGIIAEGRSDHAVITNVLFGRMEDEKVGFRYIRPRYSRDETDSAQMEEAKKGGWSRVKKECLDREKIAKTSWTFMMKMLF